GGCTDSAGNSFSKCASTASRSSSKKVGSFIGLGENPVWAIGSRSRIALVFGLKRFGGHLAVRLLQQNFHAPLSLLKLLLAFSGQANAFLKQFNRLIQRELRAFEAPDHLFQSCQGPF